MPRTSKPAISRTKENAPLEEKKKVICLNCGCKDQGEFYQSHNPFNKYLSYIPYCKKCIKGPMWDYFLKRYKNNEQLALHGLVRSLNLPYIHSIYLASVKNINNPNAKIKKEQIDEESETNKNTKSNNNVLISAYLKNYNSFYSQNGYGDTYLDSEGINEIQGLSSYEENIKLKRQVRNENLDNVDTEKYEILEYDADELVFKWGAFEDDKLIRLEREYLDWADKLGDYIYDKSTDLIVKQVCQQTVEIEEKRLRGEKVKDDVNTLQALLNSSGLIEKTRDKSAENIKIGMAIKDIENKRPLKDAPPSLRDRDKYADLIDTFAGAISRTMGKENYFTKRFDKLYKDYSINLNAFATPEDENGGN